MNNVNFSPQSKRLLEFIDLTGMTINEFGKQCDMPSPNTMGRIVKDGVSPSQKVLDKIIRRFPQLNHDWVVLGYGEMIVKGIQNQPASALSIAKSKTASFESISNSQINHDFQLNELTTRIDKALVLQAQSNQLMQNSMLQMSNQLNKKLDEWETKVNNGFSLLLKITETLPKETAKSLKKAGSNTDRILIKTLEVAQEELFKNLNIQVEHFHKVRTKEFNDARMEHIDFILKLDNQRTERINIDTNKVAEKIIVELEKNTTKAINELKANPKP